MEETVRKTRFALVCSNLFSEPFASLYLLLPFILRKDLGATPFQLGLLATLKPLVSVISFYWEAAASHRRLSLRSNLLICGILGRLPFFLFFFIHNVWFLIAAAAIYMLFYRAGMPPWMEILKLNLPKERRERLFSLGSALAYAEGFFLALSFGFLLDANSSAWKGLFIGTAILGIASTLIQYRLPVQGEKIKRATPRPFSWIKPWQEMWALMKSRPDFALFQWGFMLGGFGLMLVIPVLPLFLVDVLKLSHAEFSTARSICVGLGFIALSPVWTMLMKRLNMFQLTSFANLGFACYLIFLCFSPYLIGFVYLAFIIYGIAQAGSHMVWHLSGPLFAGEENSSRFSAVNVLMCGIRGLIGPLLGSLLYNQFGPFVPLILGTLLCFSGSWLMAAKRAPALSR